MANHVYDFGTLAPLAKVQQADKIELAARFGYAAKGLVYAALGALTLLAVLGFAKGDITGTRGALQVFNEQSWGPFALAVIATGLIGFALWRAVQAVGDPGDKGTQPTALIKRAGLLVSGGIYASLAFYAIKLLLDMTASAGGADQKAAQIMALDGGAMAIGLLGVGVIGVGFYQLLRVVRSQFKEDWKTDQMSAHEERMATLISRFGIGARAVAFVLIGVFLSWGAITGQPDKAQGMEGMLTDIAQNPWGQSLVGVAGAGLLCYGIYCFVNAFYRRINTDVGSDANAGGSRQADQD